MKNIDELGISPVPWYTGEENPYHERHVVFTKRNVGRTGGFDDKIVASCNQFFPESVADARMIKTAPKLYEALRNIFCDMCGHCDLHYDCEHGEDGMPTHCNQWHAAKEALEEASGESEEHT